MSDGSWITAGTLDPGTTALDDLVQRIVAELTGMDGTRVIPGNDDHARPPGLYATYLSIYDSGNSTWTDYIEPADPTADVDWESGMPVVSMYSIQWYRAGARAAARRFRHVARSRFGREAARAIGLTLGSIDEVRKIDTVVPGGFEERSSLDLLVLFRETVTGTVAYWNGARFVVSFEEGDRTLTEEVEVER